MMPVRALYEDTDILHGIQKDIDIPHIRHIFNIYGLVRHNRSSKNRKCRVFGTSYFHVSH